MPLWCPTFVLNSTLCYDILASIKHLPLPSHTLCAAAASCCCSGLPVYNFCVAIDDCLMGITHVIR